MQYHTYCNTCVALCNITRTAVQYMHCAFMYWYALHCNAMHCNALKCTAMHCNVLLCSSRYCHVLLRTNIVLLCSSMCCCLLLCNTRCYVPACPWRGIHIKPHYIIKSILNINYVKKTGWMTRSIRLFDHCLTTGQTDCLTTDCLTGGQIEI